MVKNLNNYGGEQAYVHFKHVFAFTSFVDRYVHCTMNDKTLDVGMHSLVGRIAFNQSLEEC